MQKESERKVSGRCFQNAVDLQEGVFPLCLSVHNSWGGHGDEDDLEGRSFSFFTLLGKKSHRNNTKLFDLTC